MENSSFKVPLTLYREDKRSNVYLAYVSSQEFPFLFENLERILHPNELSYFKTLQFERRQLSYLIGRYAGKQALSLFLNESDYTKIEIASGIFDQPVVRHLSVDTPELSLSHCQDLAVAIAFPSGHPLAVDVEKTDQNKIDVIRSQLTSNEINLAQTSPLGEIIACTLIWTIKEALSKVLKCGLMIPFAILEIDQSVFNKNGTCISYFKNFGQYKSYSWVIEDYVLSIILPQKTDMDLDIGKLLSFGHSFT